MLIQKMSSAPENLFEGFSEGAAPKARDMLTDALNSGYSQAIEHGLQPTEALAVILSWVAVETARRLPNAVAL